MSELKKYLLALLFVIITTVCFAQVNLVPNPSFEDTLSCPTSSGQINKTKYWITPTTGTPDYFNKCNGTSVGVPQNVLGNQNAYTGKAYIGIYTYAEAVANGREYAQVQLLFSLDTNKQYCVSFYTSICDSARIASDKIGAYISSNAISSSNYYLLPYTPQINNPTFNYMKNKNTWYKVQGTYVATGGEKFITIGSFNNDATTDTTYAGPDYSFPYLFSYYYIDNVSILPINLIANAGHDTTIILNDSAYIGRTSEVGLDDDCIWYVLGNSTPIDTTAGLWVKPSITTSYVLEQNICGTISYDTVIVNVSPLGIESQKQQKSAFVYPNPTGNFLNISIIGENKTDLLFTDLLGNSIISFSTEKKDNTIDLSNLPNGIYFIKLSSDKYNFTQKIIIENH